MTVLLTKPRGGSSKQTLLTLREQEQTAYVNGKPCPLTCQEFRLLAALMEGAGHVLSRDWLLRRAWDYASPGKSRTVDVHMQRLRQKLGSHLFETVHGQGYKLLAFPHKI